MLDKKKFLEYVDHFNNKRYDAMVTFFTPDFSAEYGLGGPGTTTTQIRNSPQEFIAFYKDLHQYVREALEPRDIIINKDYLFVEFWTEFHCFKDVPASFGQPWKKGDVTVGLYWVLYNLEGDKMKHVRIAHFKSFDPKMAKL